MKTVSIDVLENTDIENASREFSTDGYTSEWLSFDRNTNVSLGAFRDFIIQKNPNFFMISKGKGTYNGLWIEDISNWIKSTENAYYNFCRSMNITYENRKTEIFNWYRGVIGEWFLVKVILPNYSIPFVDTNGQAKLINFRNAIPTYTITKNPDEYGVDALAISNENKPVSIQIKFWSLFTDISIDYDHVLSHLIAESVNNGYTLPKDKNSLWIMWTGLKSQYKDISKWVRKHPAYQIEQVRFIDRDEFNRTMENDARLQNIWNNEVNLWKK